VVYKSKRLILFTEKRLIYFKLISKISQLIFALLILFCAVLGRYALLSTFAMPYLLAIIITYTVAKVKFTRMIDKLLSTSTDAESTGAGHYTHMPKSYIEAYKQIVRDVGTASSIIIVLLYLLIIGAVGFGLQDKLLPNYHLGEFPVGLLCSEIIVYCNLFILITLGWYTRRTYKFDNNVEPSKASELTNVNPDNSKTTDAFENSKDSEIPKMRRPNEADEGVSL